MNIKKFTENFRLAFGHDPESPIAFWYSDQPAGALQRVAGCLFKGFSRLRKGKPLTLALETIGCRGGRFYSGFGDMPSTIYNFVSVKEKYKKTPQQVQNFIDGLEVEKSELPYLNFDYVENIKSFDQVEGILFFASPDVLSGLVTWAHFDNDAEDSVCTIFGSACSSVITQSVRENKRQGRRTFLGGFDPSVRPWLGENILTFVIPMSRFKEMYHTMEDSCLFRTHAWSEVRERIDHNMVISSVG